MPDITFQIDGQTVTIDAEDDDALLYLLRDRLGFYGPKYGCGVGVCGACTIFMDGELARPCIVRMDGQEFEPDTGELTGVSRTVQDGTMVTIQGVDDAVSATDDMELHPVQRAWIDNDVAQCGYCQAGQIMTAIKLLERNPNPTDDEIDEAMRENVCRCGTYHRIRGAIKAASAMAPASPINDVPTPTVDDPDTVDSPDSDDSPD